MRENDPRLACLRGGHRLPFDSRPAIQALGRDPSDRTAWDALWEDLHHQGDVDEASYAAVVLLARSAWNWSGRPWELYALVATIEVERHAIQNPDLPEWFQSDYGEALGTLKALALGDLDGTPDRRLLRSALSVVAAAGDHALATMLSGLDDSEIVEYNEEHLAYSKRYRLWSG